MAVISIQLGHNATVGLSIEDKIIGVLSQEKVDNHKNSSAFPAQAILALLGECSIDPSAINTVVICGRYIPRKFLDDSPDSYKKYKRSFINKILQPIKAWVVKTKFSSIYYAARYKKMLNLLVK